MNPFCVIFPVKFFDKVFLPLVFTLTQMPNKNAARRRKRNQKKDNDPIATKNINADGQGDIDIAQESTLEQANAPGVSPESDSAAGSNVATENSSGTTSVISIDLTLTETSTASLENLPISVAQLDSGIQENSSAPVDQNLAADYRNVAEAADPQYEKLLPIMPLPSVHLQPNSEKNYNAADDQNICANIDHKVAESVAQFQPFLPIMPLHTVNLQANTEEDALTTAASEFEQVQIKQGHAERVVVVVEESDHTLSTGEVCTVEDMSLIEERDCIEAILSLDDGESNHASFDPVSRRNSRVPVALANITANVFKTNPILDELNYSVELVCSNDPSMVDFDASNSKILGLKHISKLASAIVKNTHLRVLDLRNSGVTTEGAIHLAKAIAENRVIETVNLEANAIGPDGMLQIAYCIGKNTALKTISLGHQRNSTRAIGNQAEQAFAESAQLNKTYILLI